MQLGLSIPYPDGWAPASEHLLTCARQYARENVVLEIGFFYKQYKGVPPTDEELSVVADGLRAMKGEGVGLWSAHLPFGVRYDVSSEDAQTRAFTLEHWTRIMRVAADVGMKVAVCHPSAEPIRPEEREAHFQRARETLDEAGKIAVSLGLTLAVECLPRTCLCSSAAEMYRLLDGITPMACIDVNHPHHEPPADFIRVMKDKIVTTHISDDDGLDEKHWWPGDGVIDFAGVMCALEEIGYAGPFLYELSPRDGDEAGFARQVAENYKLIGGKR